MIYRRKAKVCVRGFFEICEGKRNGRKHVCTACYPCNGGRGNFGRQYKPLLDALTVAAQKSGISIDTLTTNLAKYGAPMRALGIDTENAIALFAGWEKAGVNTEIAFSGMKRRSPLGRCNKTRKRVCKTMQQIKDAQTWRVRRHSHRSFWAKGRAGPCDAIKGGRFEVESYAKAIQNSAGTVESTYSQVVDEVDDAQLAAQNLKLGLHDLGETVAKTLGPIFLKIAQSVKQLLDRFNELSQQARNRYGYSWDSRRDCAYGRRCLGNRENDIGDYEPFRDV